MPSPLPPDPRRRGACPTLDAPMQTGDGLLARLRVADGTLSPRQLSGIAQAATRFGNGMVEITARGNLQVRGLRPDTQPDFAAVIRGLATIETGLVVETPPLAGDDPTERRDPRALARQIRDGTAALKARLGPKVTVVVEGGGQIGLGSLKADIRVFAGPDGAWHVSVGSELDERVDDPLALVLATLERLAEMGPGARATQLAGPAEAKKITLCAPVGVFARRTGTATGIALPFGATDAQALDSLASESEALGIVALRLAPHHGLLAFDAPDRFLAVARQLGFITQRDDPKLRISACVGSAGCASGHFAARALAARLAGSLPATGQLHVSGCGKGCAHPAPADWTIVGQPRGYGLVIGGRAGDTPAMTLDAHDIESVFAQASAMERA